ncbi:MAG: hypothetical protein JXR76_10440 [Deltaproteobacteria bacterium]|nr:hypothetical protein [Deltaproteobacteria bacterium]
MTGKIKFFSRHRMHRKSALLCCFVIGQLLAHPLQFSPIHPFLPSDTEEITQVDTPKSHCRNPTSIEGATKLGDPVTPHHTPSGLMAFERDFSGSNECNRLPVNASTLPISLHGKGNALCRAPPRLT